VREQPKVMWAEGVRIRGSSTLSGCGRSRTRWARRVIDMAHFAGLVRASASSRCARACGETTTHKTCAARGMILCGRSCRVHRPSVSRAAGGRYAHRRAKAVALARRCSRSLPSTRDRPWPTQGAGERWPGGFRIISANGHPPDAGDVFQKDSGQRGEYALGSRHHGDKTRSVRHQPAMKPGDRSAAGMTRG